MPKEQPKQKKYYTVKLEALVPCNLVYRVYAFDENEALLQIDKASPIEVKPMIGRKRNIKALIYEAGSLILKLQKIFRV